LNPAAKFSHDRGDGSDFFGSETVVFWNDHGGFGALLKNMENKKAAR
jgi:hypothetical protein